MNGNVSDSNYNNNKKQQWLWSNKTAGVSFSANMTYLMSQLLSLLLPVSLSNKKQQTQELAITKTERKEYT